MNIGQGYEKTLRLRLAAALSIAGLAVASVARAAPPSCPDEVYNTPPGPEPPLVADGPYFRDGDGRAVILRGVNAPGNAKVPPFATLTSASMLDPLPAWGINTLRFLFTWEAFEPAPCEYDEGYVVYYEQVLDWAAERGLYVIVDFHQDAYSRFSNGGCGDGAPAWAVTSEETLLEPKNDATCESWGTNMIFDLSHHNTWHHFHADTEGARTRYLAMVEAVAHRLSQHSSVVGYEIMNEPWGNDEELAALFQDAGDRIRQRDPDAIVFVPPHALVSSGLSDNNVAAPGYGNFAYSPHYYDGSVILFNAWLGGSVADPLNRMKVKAESWGVPMLLGEFGAPPDAGNVAGYMEALYQWLDENLVSGTQWSYTPGWRPDIKDGWNMEDFSIIDDTGSLRANFTPRPYPQKIAGTPVVFSRDDLGFELQWDNEPASGDTEIYVPEGYASDKQLSVSSSNTGDASCTLSDYRLTCDADAAGLITVVLQ